MVGVHETRGHGHCGTIRWYVHPCVVFRQCMLSRIAPHLCVCFDRVRVSDSLFVEMRTRRTYTHTHVDTHTQR